MSNVIILSRFDPSPVGNGGNHRSYQIQWDCIQAFGASNVTTVSRSRWWKQARSSLGRWGVLKWKLTQRLSHLYRNPGKAFVRGNLAIGRYKIPGLIAHYRKLVGTIQRPAVCAIEDIGFSDFISINANCGIQTVACPHNIESLDAGPLRMHSKLYNLVRLTDFADEFGILSRCAERLFISKAETGLIGGLGLAARYYPYRPVGEIRQGLEIIRKRRERNQLVPGLFLMIGTAGHKSTATSFRWFIENAFRHGLPQGVKVIVAGTKTDQLDTTTGSPPKAFEFRGWIEQAELDDLLSCAQGVLIPQLDGFGTLTRLSELVCAGVPVIASRHPMMAIDSIPSVVTVKDDWKTWYQAIQQLPGQGAPAVRPSLATGNGGKSALTDVLTCILNQQVNDRPLVPAPKV